MKKKILFIFVLLFAFALSINAETISKNDVGPLTYIIGKYMFTRNSNSNYDGKLTTQRIMLASRTVEGNQEANMIIYYKKANGDWIEALTNESISVPDTFEIEVTDINSVVNNNVSTAMAVDYTNDDIGSSTYLVGQYVFTRNVNDNYDGKLTTKRIMLAAKTIAGNSEADMIIYYKKPNGDWIEALTNKATTVPETFKVISEDLVPKVKDTTAPKCVFGSVPTIEVGNVETITLTCTDEESGVATSSLTSSSFSLGGGLSISNISTSNVTNGKKYNISVMAQTNGNLSITLNSGAIKDYAGNASASVATQINVRRTYTATFVANGASGTTSAATCSFITGSGCSLTLPSSGFTYSGWTFNGWGTSLNSTTGASAGTSISLTSNKTYYAIWKKVVTVTFNANGCTTATTTSTATIYNGATSAVVTVPTATMNSGWTSLGASASASSTSAGTAFGSSMSISGIASSATTATRYYNCRKEETRTATFNSNGGTGSTTTKTCTSTAYNGGTSTTCSVTLPSNSFTYTGWTFNGWGTSSSATSGSQAGSSVALTLNRTYYALWRKTVNVTFNANGCTTANTAATFELFNGATSGTVTVPNATMKSGWTSLGASASASSTSAGTAFGSSMSISGIASSATTATRYYNCRKEETRTATFNSNGGTGSTTTKTCTSTAYNGGTSTTCSVTLPSNSFTYTGWTFNGWGTSPSATSGMQAGQTITLTNNNMTYYALWRKTVNVTFNANGCTTANTAATFELFNGATSGTVTVPNATMKSGWTSLGASASPSATVSGTAMGSTISISISPSATNVAKYYNCRKNITRTLSFNGNGGSGSVATKLCSLTVYNGNESGSCSVILPENGFTRAGFKFNGWASSSTATDGLTAGSTLALSANSTRYATWKEIVYTVKAESLDQLNISPDRNLVVYADGVVTEFASIKLNGYTLCTSDNPTVNVYELDGITKLDVVLKNGGTVSATIVQ